MASKRQLKRIAKIYCASLLNSTQTSLVFEDTGLSDDEIDYIDKEIKRIAVNFLKENESTVSDAEKIVEEVINKNKK